MKKLTYWKIDCTTDCDCYSIRAKTKKAAIEILRSRDDAQEFDNEVRKIEIPYEDKFELMEQLYNESFDGAFTVKTYKI